MRPLVIVPTYNERENLPRLAEGLLAIPDLRVLVVDDASPDGTGDVARELARVTQGRVSVLSRTGKRGLGVAYIEGMQLALKTDADVICQMDADLSHQPTDLVRMLQAVEHAESGDRVPVRARRPNRQLASTSQSAERVGQPVHPRRVRHLRPRLHQRFPLLET
jgi:dolichol-phosphate mannosyltransferase